LNLPYHTIFFDVGGTLLKANPSIGGVYSEVAARYGIHVDPEQVEQAARKNFWEMLERNRKEGGLPHTLSLEQAKAWWRVIVRRSFGTAADSPRFEAFYQAVFDEFARPERYSLFPEVEALLQDLRAEGFRLGVISNWDARLRMIFDGYGLTPQFDTIVISCEVGAEKPHLKIFETARERALGGSQATLPLLHVGDSREDDYAGAVASGFDARIVERDKGQDLRTVLADLLD